MSLPTYRARYLPALSLAQLEAIPDRARAAVLVATGAIEQHGPHLPVGVDSFLGQAWLDRALPHLPAEAPVWVAPPITIGKSNEHTGFPGTLIISKTTLRRQLLALARQLHTWGFRSLGIVNTHGGNSAVLRYTMAEIRDTLGFTVAALGHDLKVDLPPQEMAYGFHANLMETALLLACLPEHCDPSAARCEYPARIDDPGELRPECAPAIFSWASVDLSETGIMGDAPAGTAEQGRAWLEEGGAGLARSILAFQAKVADAAATAR